MNGVGIVWEVNNNATLGVAFWSLDLSSISVNQYPYLMRRGAIEVDEIIVATEWVQNIEDEK